MTEPKLSAGRCWICGKPKESHELCGSHYEKICYAFDIKSHGRTRHHQRDVDNRAASRSRNELLKKLPPEELIAFVERKVKE